MKKIRGWLKQKLRPFITLVSGIFLASSGTALNNAIENDISLDIDVGENARLTRPLTSRLAYMAIIDVLAVGVAQLKPEAQDHLFNIVTSQSSLKLK